MSDLCYELEDITWDEFCLSDDHIVPHPSCEHASGPPPQTNGHKKPCHKVIGPSSTKGDQSTLKYANQPKEKELPPLNSRSTKMLKRDSQADAANSVFPSKHDKDSVKEVSSLASENTRTAGQCFRSNNIDSTSSEFHPNGPILDDQSAAVGENMYGYPLGPISRADDLSFFDGNHEDKVTNDLLYYGWAEIENLEDIDLFRSCDSTFGLGAGIEDDLRWLSSSDVMEGSGGGLRSDFEFPCPASSALENISKSQKALRPKETGSSINDSGTKDQPLNYGSGSLPLEDESAIVSHLSFVNGSCNSESMLVPEKKINMHKKHSKHQNRSEGERKDVYLENGDTFNYVDGLPEEINHGAGVTGSPLNIACTGIQHQKQARGPDFGFFQGGSPYLHSNCSHSDQTVLCPTLSVNKSGNSSFMSLSPKGSYATDQVQSMENSADPSFQVAVITTNEKKMDKQLHHSAIKLESKCDLEGVNMGIPTELSSSIAQESSCTSSGLGDISDEAASFHQLQHVMERLDIRTKLCIRDSLYRLAQSAEQRHRHANIDDRCTSGAFFNEGASRCRGYLDMETDTNSIDRSIAHLLFHRPANSSVLTPGNDSFALKSPYMVHGSLSCPPVMAENLISDGENLADTQSSF